MICIAGALFFLKKKTAGRKTEDMLAHASKFIRISAGFGTEDAHGSCKL